MQTAGYGRVRPGTARYGQTHGLGRWPARVHCAARANATGLTVAVRPPVWLGGPQDRGFVDTLQPGL